MLKTFCSSLSLNKTSPIKAKKDKEPNIQIPILKSLCFSLFFKQPSDKVASSKPDNTCRVSCPSHPDQLVTGFCLKENCDSPAICGACKTTHNKTHQASYISLQNFFNDQLLNQYNKNLNNKFSLEHIEEIHRESITILNKMEEEVVRSIRDLKKDAEEFFANLSETVEKLRDVYQDYKRLVSLGSTRYEIETRDVKQLISNYRTLKSEIKVFDLNLEAIPQNLKRDAETATNKFKFEILAKLNAAIDLKPVDFFKLKVKTSYNMPASEGVLYEACAYIPKLKMLAVGYRKNQQGSLGLYNLENQEVVTSIENVHKRWINHVIWVEKWNAIVTCSNDTKIKVFIVKEDGSSMKSVATFRGHTNLVRCIKYLDSEDLLVSAGDDPDIKIWDLKSLKRYATISTNGSTNMDGSIAFIEKDKLVGVGFRCGYVRFYNLYKRTLAFEFKTGYENFYTYALQYLPKRNLILGRVKENVIKVWKYDSDKKKVEQYRTINTKGSYPDCIVPNEDESQLLFTSRDKFLEMYDFNSEKTALHNVSPHITKTNALVYLENMGKISVCDYTSGKICILH